MNDREALLRDLNEGRFLALLALADLEEEGGDLRRARGWRWLAENGRWPLEVVRYDIDEEPKAGQPKRYDYPGLLGWEWWREKEAARFGCSLPPLLMEHVRKMAKTPKGATCHFESASQALGCAATCAGVLIEAELLD